MRSYLFPLVLGLCGAGILIALGVWQLQRLEWKEGILAEIDSRISAAPVPLPADPDPVADKYRPVQVAGRYIDQPIHVLGSTKADGAGYRVIQGFETQGRRILVDRGFIHLDDKAAVLQGGPLEITGNLHWPAETDGYTPDPDLAKNIWFARDVTKMAKALDTEETLIVVRMTSDTDPLLTHIPLTGTGIPNNHLQYAITWFLLTLVWLGMTLYMMWRIRRSKAIAAR
ncbi:SURF1 family protein [Algirhabdus cladophorae]